MNAKEARELTEENLKEDDKLCKSALDDIYQQIFERAKQGESVLVISVICGGTVQSQKIINSLVVADGYKVSHITNANGTQFTKITW